MKKTIIPLLVLLAFVACSCQAPPKVVAAKTLASIGYSVDNAMKVYATAYAKGIVTQEQRAKVVLMHDIQFGPMYKAAVLAVKGDLSQATPEELGRLAGELVAYIYSIAN